MGVSQASYADKSRVGAGPTGESRLNRNVRGGHEHDESDKQEFSRSSPRLVAKGGRHGE